MSRKKLAKGNRFCLQCGREFTPNIASSRFCSKACYDLSQHTRAMRMPVDDRHCRNCGQTLPQGDPPGYCFICASLPDEEARVMYRHTGNIFRRHCRVCGGLTNDYICKSCRGRRWRSDNDEDTGSAELHAGGTDPF